MSRPVKSKASGFTLLELIIAVLVLSLGTLAATRATDQSRLAIGGSSSRLLAEIVAANRAEELRLNAITQIPLPSVLEMGGNRFTIETTQDVTSGGMVRAEINARSQSGQGSLLVTYLPISSSVQP